MISFSLLMRRKSEICTCILRWENETDENTDGCIKEGGPLKVTDARGAVGDAFDGDVGW